MKNPLIVCVKKIGRFAVAVGLFSSTLPTAAPQESPKATGGSSDNVYRMKLVRIVDETGFEKPMTALSLLVPVDWQFQGSVQYLQDTVCHINRVHLGFRAVSPDGRLAVELLPGNNWQWVEDRGMQEFLKSNHEQAAKLGIHGCDLMPVTTADQFLRDKVIPNARPDAKVIASEPMPATAKLLEEEALQIQIASLRQRARISLRTNASRVRVGYPLEGHPVEEWFTAMISSTGITGTAVNLKTARLGRTQYYTVAADHVVALRAPQGQLDAEEKFFQLILGTMRVDPQWQARVKQALADLQAKDAKAAAGPSAPEAKAGQETSQPVHDTPPAIPGGAEHSMEGWSHYIRGVQTFRNPATGETVDLSSPFGYAWTGPDDQYIVTDSASFSPSTSAQGKWTRLEPVSH